MALDHVRDTAEDYQSAATDVAGDLQEQATSALADVEAAASAALSKAEAFIKENPVAAAVGIGAAGILIALAVTSRRSQNAPLDSRLLSELNRHSEDVVRAVRRNANSFANSETAGAIETFVSNLVTNLVKVPEAVSKQVANLAK